MFASIFKISKQVTCYGVTNESIYKHNPWNCMGNKFSTHLNERLIDWLIYLLYRTGKLYHLRLRVECTFFVIYKAGREPTPLLVIGLYGLLGNPTT